MDINAPFYFIAFILSLTVTAAVIKKLIPMLKTKAAQPIYEEGPDWHLKKQGTPTMGGLGFLIAISLSLLGASLYLFATDNTYFAISLLLSAAYGLLNSVIGIIDDISKIKKKENAGLSPIEKIILQTVAAALFIIARRIFLHDSSVINFSFGAFDLGFFYFPLTILMLVGTVNAANLTDGIDGIAASVAFAIGISLAFISVNSSLDVAFTSFAIAGGAIGFLVYNLHPAKIFMGDTGSLYFGALIGAACVSLGNPLIILTVGAVYVIEAISVILQVSFYKLTKKRIFKMAPFHHHLEKCGFSENKIVIYSILVTLVASVAAYFITV